MELREVIERPLLTVRAGRDVFYGDGFRFILIFAPWPAAEQTEGRLADALINMGLSWRRGGVSFDFHTSDPADRPMVAAAKG